MIQFKNVIKTFETKEASVTALDDVSLKIGKGEINGVIGLSGAGKSTLIRCVNLLERPTQGEVILNGVELTKLRGASLQKQKRNIGMIFQHFNLLNSKTVYENIAMPLKLVNKSQSGLFERKDNYPEQLSGGQKQRVGIARALASNPSILLCDEATSALDPETTNSILELLKKINDQYQITILIITHEMSVIQEVCDKVAVMEGGKIIEKGTVLEVFSNPQNNTTKNFVRSVIKATIPKSVMSIVQNQGDNSRVCKIEFIGASTGKPLLSQLIREFDVDINVLFGNITEIQDTPFGNLVVQIQGPLESIEQAYTYVNKQNLAIKEVKEPYA